jgi:hypothetical protein
MNTKYICNATCAVFKIQLGIVIALEETITSKVMRNYHLDYIVMPTLKKESLGQIMKLFF